MPVSAGATKTETTATVLLSCAVSAFSVMHSAVRLGALVLTSAMKPTTAGNANVTRGFATPTRSVSKE